MPGCPTCGAELTYLEPYARHYCQSCRSYAPRDLRPCDACGRGLVFVPEDGTYYCYGCQEYKEHGGAGNPCPTCGGPLEFIVQYNRSFCYRCNEYAPEDRGPVEHEGGRGRMTETLGAATGFAPFSREEMDLASKDQLIRWCKEYRLDESGMKYELRLRLLEYIRRQGLLLKGEEPLEEDLAVGEAPPAPPPAQVKAPGSGEAAQAAVVEAPAEPVQAAEQAVCQNCGGDLTYIPQYGRSYCYSCNTYAPSDGAAEAGHTAPAQAPLSASSDAEARAEGNPKVGLSLAAVGLVLFIAHQVLFVAPAVFQIPVFITGAEIAFALPLLGIVLVTLGLMAGVLSVRPRE